jgi:hypothetical protein
MDELNIKAADLEEKHVITIDNLLEAQEQVEATMDEASVVRDVLWDVIVNNAA